MADSLMAQAKKPPPVGNRVKSKMYSYVKDNEKGGRTAKGIKRM